MGTFNLEKYPIDMVSALVKERFAALLLEIADSEKRTEITRQVLVDRSEFDAYSAFRRITTEHYGGITLFELKEFLSHHDIQVESYELDLLFIHLDHDQNGIISWSEFLNIIMSREYHSGCQYGKIADFSLEMEHSLMRVFEQELANEINLEARRRTLWDTPSMNEQALFNLLDVDDNGFITMEDIHGFLRPYDDSYNFSKSERCFRRADANSDDRIVFSEFLKTIRPIYCYKNYNNSLPQKKEMSPTKIYRKPLAYGLSGDGRSSRGSQKGFSRGNSRNASRSRKSYASGISESRRVVRATEYDALTGRPVGSSLRVVRGDNSEVRRQRPQQLDLDNLERHNIGLNPQHPINTQLEQGQRWDRLMSWNPGMDPMYAMMHGYHPLDVAASNRGQHMSPLDPENPNSPLKNILAYPTPEEM